MMKKHLMAATFALGIAGAACGSSNSSDSPSMTGEFAGSCTTTAAAWGGTGSEVDCTETYGISAAALQSTCSGTGKTYSADHCPTANLIGKCTNKDLGTIGYYYSMGGDTAKEEQGICTNDGGNWSNP